jgi:opacity protein-like surface antigen
MKIFYIVNLCLVGFATNAQTVHFDATPHFSLAIPFNEFAEVDTASQAYFGMGADVTFSILDDTPLRLGLGFSYYWTGSKDKDITLTDNTGYEYEINSKVRGSMAPLHLRVRADARNYLQFPVLPYAGGFAGMRFFTTNNRVSIDFLDGSEPEIEHNRKTSVTSSYGFEAGLHIRINTDLLIDVRYERAFGGWAKYLDLSSVEINDQGIATYKQLETRTDVEFFTIGLTVELN